MQSFLLIAKIVKNLFLIFRFKSQLEKKIYKRLPVISKTILKLAILFFLFLPIFIVFMCPIFLVRYITSTALRKLFRPDLVSILPARDMFYAVDEITASPKSSVVVTIVCQGQLSKEIVVSKLESTLKIKEKDSDALMYPQLKRYLVKWCGFIFWKDDADFSVQNHVDYINPNKFMRGTTTSDEKVLTRIENFLVQEAFPENRSPWSLKILQNYEPQEFPQNVQDCNMNSIPEMTTGYSVALLKFHHSFVDGFSLLNFLTKGLLSCPSGEMSLPNFLQRSFVLDLLIKTLLIVKAPYDFLSDVLKDHDDNLLYLRSDKITNIIHSATSHRIPSERIKNIANNFNGTFTGVIVAAITGGIRSFLLDNGNKVGPKTSFTCLAPFPVPGHPETLGNYVSDCYIDFPIRIPERSLRLAKVERDLKELKISTTFLSSFVMQPLFGSLFHWMVKAFVEFCSTKSTGIFSSFPSYRATCKSPSGDCVDTHFTAGHDSPGIGIQFLAINYNQGWKLKIQADEGCLSSDDEVAKLLQHILAELDALEFESTN